MKKNVIRIYFSLLFIGQFVHAQQSEKFSQKIASQLLKEDVRILKENLESIYPGLYVYTSKEEMNVGFKNTDNGLIPKHQVINIVNQEINKEDAALAYTVDIIKTKK